MLYFCFINTYRVNLIVDSVCIRVGYRILGLFEAFCKGFRDELFNFAATRQAKFKRLDRLDRRA